MENEDRSNFMMFIVLLLVAVLVGILVYFMIRDNDTPDTVNNNTETNENTENTENIDNVETPDSIPDSF